MAKDDFTCDVCGEYVPPHDPDCVFGVNGKKRAAEEAAKKAKSVKRQAR